MSSIDSRTYEVLLPLITAERLGSYVQAAQGRLIETFLLYEWNMRASAGIIELTSMIEVLVRNALDRELRRWAEARHPDASWFDVVPLDRRGIDDVRKARQRATRQGHRSEVHGRVVAELSLGFWRYLVESRYLTALWVPATHAAFPRGAVDLRTRQREVAFALQQLNFVRNRAAHHEPIHQRDIDRDLQAALEIASWIAPEAADWVRARSMLPDVLAMKPGR